MLCCKSNANKASKMPMTLYCMDGSPPVRAVYLCLEALGLKPERKWVDLLKNENRSPEYLKMNPQHTVPTLVDDGFIIWDSHAINTYLVSKYAKDDSLYPKDVKKRAIVDQRLHFDSGTLFPRMRECVGLVFQKHKEIPEENRQKVYEVFDFMDKFLGDNHYLAGNSYTLADMNCVACVATLVDGLGVPIDGHPKVKAWLNRCKETLPGYNNAMDKGIAMIKGLIDANRNA